MLCLTEHFHILAGGELVACVSCVASPDRSSTNAVGTDYKMVSEGLPAFQSASYHRLYQSSLDCCLFHCSSAMAGNQAIHVNPPNAQEHVSMNGSDWLWAAFSIQAFSLLAAFVAFVAVCIIHILDPSLLTGTNHLQRPRGTRLFHNIALVVMATSSVAYFSMASDLGATPIETEFRTEATRQIWVSSKSKSARA